MPDKLVLQCKSCKKKLAEAVLTDAEISIKCKCGTLNKFVAAPERKTYTHNLPYQDRMNLVNK